MCAKLSHRLFFRLGFPAIIISDQGREFNNKVVDEICKIIGMDHRQTSAYHPQTNGLTGTMYIMVMCNAHRTAIFFSERFNQTLEDMLSKTMAEHPDEEWDEVLDDCLFAYRSSKHASTGYSPFFLMYNRNFVQISV